MNTQSIILSILDNPEFQKLQQVGGCKQYHQEGNAFVHTFMVYVAAVHHFHNDEKMQLTALLHDIGKITHNHQLENGDWTYPHHSDGGAEELEKFLYKEYPDFQEIQWYIRNHIKPLFWRTKNYVLSQCVGDLTPYPGGRITKAMVKNLIGLVICDLEGSTPADEDEWFANVIYLENLERQL